MTAVRVLTRVFFPTGVFIHISAALSCTYLLHCNQMHISLQLLFTSPDVLLQLIRVLPRMLIPPHKHLHKLLPHFVSPWSVSNARARTVFGIGCSPRKHFVNALQFCAYGVQITCGSELLQYLFIL